MKTGTSVKLIVLGLVLVAVGLGIRLVARRISPEQVRRAVHDALAGALEAQVEVGSARLEGPGLVRVADVSVTAPGETSPLLTCPEVLIGLNPFALLGSRPPVQQIALVCPEVRLAYLPQEGAWNVAAVRLKRGPRAGAAGGPPLHSVVLEDATVVLSDPKVFPDANPRTYRGLHVALTPDPRGSSWQVEGRILRGPLAGVRLAGRLVAGDEARFGVEVGAERLAASEALWRLVPHGDTVWRDFRIEGALSFSASIAPGAEGRPDYALHARMTDARLTTPYFPARLESASGTVELAGRRLTIRDVMGVMPTSDLDDTAVAPVPAHVRVNGSWDLKSGAGSCHVEAADLSLCRTTVQAIPSAGPALWEELRPTGRVRLELAFSNPSHTSAASFTAAAELDGASLAPRELPWPVREINGSLVADNRGVRLRNVTGILAAASPPGQQPARVAADGRVDFDRRDSLLNVAITNLRTDERVVRAIPGFGPQLWDQLQPQVDLDATLLLQDQPGADTMDCVALLNVHGGRITPPLCPAALTDLAGAVKVEGTRVTVERLTGTLAASEDEEAEELAAASVELRGTADAATGEADFHLVARNVELTEALLAGIPGVGERIWQEANPEGTVSVSGRIRHDGRAEPPLRYLLDVALQDVSLLPTALPVPLEAVSGQLLLTERRALSNSFAGVTCGGQFNGAAVVHYTAKEQPPTYGVLLHFEQLELAELVRHLRNEEPQVEGALTGTVDLGGMMGDASSVSGAGTLSLAEGRLWKTPFFVSLLNVLHLTVPADNDVPVTGDALFDIAGQEVKVRAFEMTGGGLSVSGVGSVWLDGRLDLRMVAVGAPEKGAGIPIVSSVVGWFVTAVERQLVRLDVTGTLARPKFEHQVLSKITWPLTSLRSVLLSPIFGRSPAPAPKQ